jgi:hypothetical protein
MVQQCLSVRVVALPKFCEQIPRENHHREVTLLGRLCESSRCGSMGERFPTEEGNSFDGVLLKSGVQRIDKRS